MAARGEREVINLVDDKDEPQPAKGVGAPAKGGGARVAPPPPPVQNVGVQLAGVAPPPPTQNFEFVERLGDLFLAPAHTSLVHAVGRDLVCGEGIAEQFVKKMGGVEEMKAQHANVGDVVVLRRGPRFIYGLVTKPWSRRSKPTYASMEASLRALRTHVLKHDVRDIAMPRIGCGLDKLEWGPVRSLILRVFQGVPVRITVYTL